ncbi:hypothetical protein TNIN_240341 [Trichonephila inaurata madagascariensis]|uniref:Uncharacterized protein n=1 Tax=Trichonephila inaurata madagascariensis TaxID=2747483 RepID=A0A8X6YKJ2_9ARAC|nr:hypothetical protein TNIN_240341 [Trichonephila inaurata madagascariensis]
MEIQPLMQHIPRPVFQQYNTREHAGLNAQAFFDTLQVLLLIPFLNNPWMRHPLKTSRLTSIGDFFVPIVKKERMAFISGFANIHALSEI